MPKVAVVADGTHCLPSNLVKEYDIHVAHASIVIDGKSYRDTELTNDDFWKLFYQANGRVTSSAAGIGEFYTIFDSLAESTDSIVCIVVSKELSGTYEFAVQAAEKVRKEHAKLRIEIIDSKTSAGAMGFVVLETARAAKQGKKLDEVVRVAQNVVLRVKLVLGLDTLKYLIRGGRAPKTGYIGELIQVKPIIGSVSGRGVVELLGKVRGKNRLLLKLAELVKENTDTGKPVNIMVHYTDGITAGEELKDIVATRVKCGEVYLTPLTPAMCSHLGPVVAVAFYS